ncbi:MAG: hypothetical protein R6W31_14910, partial [Bacteroidales bacterium]
MKNRQAAYDNFAMIALKVRVFFLIALGLAGLNGFAQDHTIPGEVTTPFPTLINLSVEWNIRGDDNLNGVVSVSYREKGAQNWKEGMPLRRVPAGKNIGFKWTNRQSGSIFDLLPGTSYEIKLNLEDPDGGSAEAFVEAATRPIPEYGDHAEIIELQAGQHDTLQTRDGTQDKPVVYRCSSGEAIYTHIDLNNRKWVFIEGVTVTNPNEDGIGIQFIGARNCVIRRCNVNAVYGIVAYLPGAENCYIADNVVTGICPWTNEAMG